MTQQLSKRLKRLSPSATLAMSQKSSEMKATGIDVINMTVGEPDFMTPNHIKEAAKKAIDENYSKYSPVAGFQELRKAIVNKLKIENNLNYNTNEVVVSTGGKQAVCNTILSLIDHGDEVIIPAPYWVSYPQMVLLAGGKPIYVSASFEQNFKITPAQIEKAISEKTKLIILCSPSNPTGSVYTADELEALSKVILKYENLYVLSDEIYEHITYTNTHTSIASFKNMKDRTIICNGVSKAYAMTGWRLGWVAAPEWIAKGVCKLQSQYTSGASSVSQMAALAAYESNQSCVKTSCSKFKKRRDLIVNLAKEIADIEVNVPEGAFYLFPKCSKLFGKKYNDKQINTATDLAMFLLEEAHVAVVGGDDFGAPDCFRISYATSEENIITALKRIKSALLKLK